MRAFRLITAGLTLFAAWAGLSVPYGPVDALPEPRDQVQAAPTHRGPRPCDLLVDEAPLHPPVAGLADGWRMASVIARVRVLSARNASQGGVWLKVHVLETLKGDPAWHGETLDIAQDAYTFATRHTCGVAYLPPLRPSQYVVFLTWRDERRSFQVWDFPLFRIDDNFVVHLPDGLVEELGGSPPPGESWDYHVHHTATTLFASPLGHYHNQPQDVLLNDLRRVAPETTRH